MATPINTYLNKFGSFLALALACLRACEYARARVCVGVRAYVLCVCVFVCACACACPRLSVYVCARKCVHTWQDGDNAHHCLNSHFTSIQSVSPSLVLTAA